MKSFRTVLAIVLSLTAATGPALAVSVDMSGLTPTLTYPEPVSPPPVTKSDSGIDK